MGYISETASEGEIPKIPIANCESFARSCPAAGALHIPISNISPRELTNARGLGYVPNILIVSLPFILIAAAAARRSWFLRGVVLGLSKEVKTSGLPSPSFGGFGFFDVVSELSMVAG